MQQSIQWCPEMRTGVPALDEQHRGILSLLNELILSSMSPESDEGVADKLRLFSRAVREHFLYEEEYQSSIGYPDIGRHRGEHLAYATRVAWICQQTSSAADALPQELLDFLCGWWEEHILVEDAKYGDFVSRRS